MRIFQYLTVMVLLLGVPGMVIGASVARPAGVDKALRDLSTVLIQVQKDRSDEMQAQMDMETRLLGNDGRTQLDNRLTMDSDTLDNYVDEGLNDICYLRANWKFLTPFEKSDVEDAEAVIKG